MPVPERDNPHQPLFNNMPAGVLFLMAGILGVALLRWISPACESWVVGAASVFAASDAGWIPQQPLGPYPPYLLHVFVHFGLLHLLLNSAALIGLGRMVGFAFGASFRGTAGFLAFFFACSLVGAVAAVVLNGDERMIMAGASTGISGLIAAAGWLRGGFRGAMAMAGPWILINMAMGLTDMVIQLPIGWHAHIGGALAGLALFPVFLSVFGDHQRRSS